MSGADFSPLRSAFIRLLVVVGGGLLLAVAWQMRADAQEQAGSTPADRAPVTTVPATPTSPDGAQPAPGGPAPEPRAPADAAPAEHDPDADSPDGGVAAPGSSTAGTAEPGGEPPPTPITTARTSDSEAPGPSGELDSIPPVVPAESPRTAPPTGKLVTAAPTDPPASFAGQPARNAFASGAIRPPARAPTPRPVSQRNDRPSEGLPIAPERPVPAPAAPLGLPAGQSPAAPAPNPSPSPSGAAPNAALGRSPVARLRRMARRAFRRARLPVVALLLVPIATAWRTLAPARRRAAVTGTRRHLRAVTHIHACTRVPPRAHSLVPRRRCLVRCRTLAAALRSPLSSPDASVSTV
jgi:hypothetical protein